MNTPDDSTFRVLDWVISVVGGLLFLLWGMLTGRIKKIEDENARIATAHTTLEIRIAGDYVPKRDLEKLSDALFRKLDNIEALLHQKADK